MMMMMIKDKKIVFPSLTMATSDADESEDDSNDNEPGHENQNSRRPRGAPKQD